MSRLVWSSENVDEDDWADYGTLDCGCCRCCGCMCEDDDEGVES